MFDDEEEKKHRIFPIVATFAFGLALVAVLVIIFPIANPIEVIGETLGTGVLFVLTWGVIISLLIILYYATRSSIVDIVNSIAEELGIDLQEITSEYKKLIRDEWLIMRGKKERPSDHHDAEE